MKKTISIFLLVLILSAQITGCSKQNSKKYNVSNDFKNQSVELLEEIRNDPELSNSTQTDVSAFLKETSGNSKYTKDEQNLAELIFNYYGQLLIVSTAEASMHISGDNKNYNKQKATADSIKSQIDQYLK